MLPVLQKEYCKLTELSFEETKSLYERLDQWKRSQRSIISDGSDSNFCKTKTNWLDLEWEDELINIQKKLESFYPTNSPFQFIRISANEKSTSSSNFPWKNLRSSIFSDSLYQDCCRYWFGEISLAAFRAECQLKTSFVDPLAFRKRKWPWRFFWDVFFEIAANRDEHDQLLVHSNVSNSKNAHLTESNLIRIAKFLWSLPYPSRILLRLCRISQPRYLTGVEIQSVSEILSRRIQKGRVPSLLDLCILKAPPKKLAQEKKFYPPVVQKQIRFLLS